MNNELKYSGYTAVPSDYECPDGTLAASTNLVCEDSQIKPVFTPKVLMRFIDRGRLVLIHHVPNQVNYIIQRGSALYWMQQPEEFGGEVTDGAATLIKEYGTINDLAIIGNTIAIASTDMEYILWKDNSYHILGSKPPFTNISFGCQKAGNMESFGEDTIMCKTKGYNETFGWITFDSTITANGVFGCLNSKVAEHITQKGYFYMPFFVRYAYRLYDGTHQWLSAPILMLPSVIRPLLKVADGGDNWGGNDKEVRMKTTCAFDYFALWYSIPEVSEELHKWSDIIAGIDIFVTPQIYTYDPSGKIESFAFGFYSTGYLHDPLDFSFDILNPTPHDYIVGHFSNETPCRFLDHTVQETFSFAPSSPLCWDLPLNENFDEQIKTCQNGCFYKLAEIDLDNVVAHGYSAVPLKQKDLSNLVNRETLKDEFQAHHEVKAKTCIAYNNRLCITDLTISAPKPFSLLSSVDATTSDSSHRVEIEVYTRLNGVISHAINDDSQLWDMNNAFPRYLFYPDNSAYKMNLKYGTAEQWANGQVDHWIPLTAHPYLNGAYFLGYISAPFNPTFTTAETIVPVESITLGNKIYVSEVNNPFTFPPQNIVTVGNGLVMGLASAAKALSQGQFGQFPLYAFTTEGVWALEVSSTGTFSARQPISRDVCLDAKSITPIDSSVLFATKRGIMQIAGSSTSCISDIIKTETPFDVLDLPHLDDLHRTLRGHVSDNCIPTQAFTEFLQGCGMIYDYIAQRIIVYNPQRDYAYIYSLKSQQWGMMMSQFSFGVPSYPDAFAIQSISYVPYNFLVDLDKTSEDISYGILVTRPIKLLGEGVNGDMLKTIDTVIQRGNFARGHVQTVLYGSRDLKNWFVVWSSKDHYLRGFRGTGYKYFRIALVTSMTEGESIFGASINSNPRHTNQLR